MTYQILDHIKQAADLKSLNLSELKILANELREDTIEIVSKTGGHLGAGLGVVELTIALHYVFNTPTDKLIWDIGHQAYPHKILTGRRDKMYTLRQKDGLSGFTKRAESEFDPFGAGHSSTSISAALGMACARDLAGKSNEVIAVIGDGAISAGMAYEAMNNADSLHSRVIVILNDNDMSISNPVGGMNKYLTKLISSKPYLNFRETTKNFTKKYTTVIARLLKKMERNTKDLFENKSNFFEELGFYYLGPIDGHDLDNLIEILQNIRDDKTLNCPILLHVVTEKGKGFDSPDCDLEKYHAVAKFDRKTKTQQKNAIITYTDIFAESLIEQMKKDDKIVAITAAMPSGTGLNKIAQLFPSRVFDVGIAEQHAVTFAAGLAAEGCKPFVAIYSTFLQRAYDQVIHDVVIQNLPVRFAIDRAGYVGNDGPTHAGSYDIAYLSNLPNIVVMAPSDANELRNMIATAVGINDRPCSFRYPRGKAVTIGDVKDEAEILEIGKGRVIKAGKDCVIVSLGTRLQAAIEASDILAKINIDVTIIDARFANPIDFELIERSARTHKIMIIIEEGAVGGFSSVILDHLANKNMLSSLEIKALHYPIELMEQDSQDEMHKNAMVDAENIAKIIQNMMLKIHTC